jgi:acyl-CoA synthetase (AMP-forming)/AMP-acid ligase II
MIETVPDWAGNVPSLLKLTSGTTAAPRAIRFRSHQLLADCNQICDTMGISDDDLNFAVIPVSHSYGFSNLLTPLIVRGVPMVMSRDTTPRAVLADLARTHATVFPGTPVFYQAFCDMGAVSRLPKLRLCISAGAPLSREVAKKFFEKFNQPIHSFYGASECGGICYDRHGTIFEDRLVGAPMQGVEVELLDPTEAGSRIRVRSAAVSDGYFPEDEEQKLGHGIFVPDDLLARHNSALKIVGRVSDVINVAGKKVNPAEVEAHLLRYTGVRQAVVFGRRTDTGLRNEEVAACVLASAGVSETELLRFCRNGLSGWQVPKRIFMVETIPTNERGKISRRELARQFSGPDKSSPLPTLAS